MHGAMKHIRINKQKKALQALKAKTLDRSELDKNVFDMVLKTLYLNTNKSEMDLEKEIFAGSSIKIPRHEAERLWNVLTSSSWVSPAVGFGKAGKVELTKAGYQLMSQFGSYIDYLTSVENSQRPQTVILPIAMPNLGDDSEHTFQISATTRYKR